MPPVGAIAVMAGFPGWEYFRAYPQTLALKSGRLKALSAWVILAFSFLVVAWKKSG